MIVYRLYVLQKTVLHDVSIFAISINLKTVIIATLILSDTGPKLLNPRNQHFNETDFAKNVLENRVVPQQFIKAVQTQCCARETPSNILNLVQNTDKSKF